MRLLGRRVEARQQILGAGARCRMPPVRGDFGQRFEHEPALGEAEPGSRYQFERHGYFVADTADSRPGAPVFNRAVTLRDSWVK